MSEIDRLKFELAEAVKRSDEYKNYLYYWNRINQNEELKHSVNEIRRLNFEFQNSEELNISYEDVDELCRRLEKVRPEDLAGEFLKAESCFCRMIQDIFGVILQDIDFDLDFLK